MSGKNPGRISPRRHGVITQRPFGKRGVTRLLPHDPIAHQDRRPDTATPAAVGSGKRNPNRARTTEGQATSPRLHAEPDSDVTLAASFGGSGGDSEYVELARNFPTRFAITPYLAGHIG